MDRTAAQRTSTGRGPRSGHVGAALRRAPPHAASLSAERVSAFLGRAILTRAVLVGAVLVGASAVVSAAEGPSGGTPLGVVQELGEPGGAPRSGEDLERVTEELSSKLRCPVCQGMSVADSNSISALAMRDEIRELFAKGYTEEQIVAYFERSYGEFVLLVPKARGFNLLVWLLPGVGLLVGLAIVLLQTRRGEVEGGSGAGGVDDDLADYRARVLREVDDGRPAE